MFSKKCRDAQRQWLKMNIENTPDRFWRKVNTGKQTDCWNWQAQTLKGYGRLRYKGRHAPAHRVAWILSNGPIPAGLLVCHHCDNPLCCNPKHLFLGTQQDNWDDCISKGRHCHGEKCYKARLTAKQVLKIRKQKSEGFTLQRIADIYKMSKSAIAHIIKRRSWHHL